jgi:putative transposase
MAKKKLKMKRQRFGELTTAQWQDIKEIVDTGRKRKYNLSLIVTAILRIARTGLQWRNLEGNYPPWSIVYYYFRKWQADGTWSRVLRVLVRKERHRQGRDKPASAAAVDSQSVKKGSLVSLDTGVDGGKLVNGRKRHLAVDTLGLPLALHVSSAQEHDGQAGVELLWQLEQASDQLKVLRADQAYGGYFKECAQLYQWSVEISQKPESPQGFVPQKGRWQVERSFAWLNFFRRLSKDYEKTTASSLCFLQLAFIDILLARLST